MASLLKKTARFNDHGDITEAVVSATGLRANPRLAEVMPSLVRHLHGFAREVELTTAEWMAAINLINECGRISDDMRNETQLLCDVLGLESLVDAITSDLLAASSQSRSSSKSDGMAPTPSAILGPFYRAGAPVLPTGSSIVQAVSANVPWYAAAQAKLARFTGHVYSCAPGSPTPMPLAGAVVDVWLSAPNGLYEQQDASQPGMNLRGQFATDARGAYAFYAMRPTAYPIPDDGPAGRLLGLLDRSPWRPAHVHFIVSAPGHRTLTTQVFDAECEYVAGDSVFAVKRELVVEFRPLHGDEKAKWYLDYDFVLSHEEANGASS